MSDEKRRSSRPQWCRISMTTHMNSQMSKASLSPSALWKPHTRKETFLMTFSQWASSRLCATDLIFYQIKKSKPIVAPKKNLASSTARLSIPCFTDQPVHGNLLSNKEQTAYAASLTKCRLQVTLELIISSILKYKLRLLTSIAQTLQRQGPSVTSIQCLKDHWKTIDCSWWLIKGDLSQTSILPPLRYQKSL